MASRGRLTVGRLAFPPGRIAAEAGAHHDNMTRPFGLPVRHLVLAVFVAAIWGSNFIVVKTALDVMPPVLMATLRFLVAAVPAVLVLPRPAVPTREIAAYGLLIGTGQFGLMYIAMNGYISPGLASLVIQMQVFFTVGLAVWLLGEKPRTYQMAALLTSFAGIAVIAMHTDRYTSAAGLALVLVAAMSCAGGNLVARRAGRVNMLSYMAWSSLYAVPPLLLLSLVVEGPAQVWGGIMAANAGAWAAVLWQSIANTLFGYGAWAWLLARYPVATIAPTALLVPVFGLGGAAVWLGERLHAWKMMAAALVILGLGINVLWPRTRSLLAGRPH
ncbi:membrane protein [Cupriavidus sp. TA19]|nr:membrane protein [Cupriavidus sp. TA19]